MNSQRHSTPLGGIEGVFGDRVRQLRALRGLSQAGLATAVSEHGVRLDTSAVNKIERALRGLRLNEAAALATALNVDLAVLLDPTRPLLTAREQLAHAEAELEQLEAVARLAAANVDTARARAERLRRAIEQEEQQA